MAEPRLTPEELATILSWFPVPTERTVAEDLHRMGAEIEACWEERRVAVEALERIASARPHYTEPTAAFGNLKKIAKDALAKLRDVPKEASDG